MLDTNICIAAINSSSDKLIKTLISKQPHEISISSITLAELAFGVSKSTYKDRNAQALETFVSVFSIAHFDTRAAYVYGDLQSTLTKRGTLIGPLDMLIAAHALSLNVTLVTDNLREFERIKGLKLVNWVR